MSKRIEVRLGTDPYDAPDPKMGKPRPTIEFTTITGKLEAKPKLAEQQLGTERFFRGVGAQSR